MSEFEGYWDDTDPDDDFYREPPLYPVGKLSAMTLEQLVQELERQCDRQGRLGDAEYINDRLVEETEMRCRMVSDEIKRRKAGDGARVWRVE